MEERKDISGSDLQSFKNLFKAYDVGGTGKVDKNAIKEAVSTLEGGGNSSLLNQVESQPEKLDINSFINIFKGSEVSESMKKQLMNKAGKVTQVMKLSLIHI